METLRNVLTKRGIPFYFMAASVLSAVIMLILYRTTGVTEFTPVLNGKVIALITAFIVLAVLLTVFEVKVLKYGLYLFGLFMWLEYVTSEVNYIANVFVSIDGNSFTPSFILTVLFGLLAWACVLASAILQKPEIGSAPAPAGAA